MVAEPLPEEGHAYGAHFVSVFRITVAGGGPP